jgi:membrane protein implicated in regulation of membrane protease activity
VLAIAAMAFTVGLLIWFGIAALCVNGARARGRSEVAWGALGLLFGLFALVALYVLPPSGAPSPATQMQGPSPDRDLDRLGRLHELRAAGALSLDEYERQKAAALARSYVDGRE